MKNNWFKENVFKSKKNIVFSSIALAGCIALTVITGSQFVSFSKYQTYFWGTPKTAENPNGNPNVTRVEKFSDYSPSLKGTNGDADIYVLDSGVEGPSLLVLGGTHPNEPSGQLTATVLLENLKVNRGKVFIVTETNKSAFTHSYPQEGSPFYYHIQTLANDGTVTGTRQFKFGSRATNTNDQWPNPDIYVHEYSGQKLSTSETRNMNRAYPGKANGTFTERCAYAVTRLVQENDITVTIDLHEASPEYQTINAMISHEKGAKQVADRAVTALDSIYKKIDATDYITSQPSATNLHGLTHRELGDHTDTLPLICETSNASQGKYKGAFTEGLILYRDNNDVYYEYCSQLDDSNTGTADGSLYARPTSIEERVARHASSICEYLNAYNNYFFDVETGEPNANSYFNHAFMIDSGDFVATKFKTNSALVNNRKNLGLFDIDFSNITDKYSGTFDAEASTSEKVYYSLYNESIGKFLHSTEN